MTYGEAAIHFKAVADENKKLKEQIVELTKKKICCRCKEEYPVQITGDLCERCIHEDA